MKEKISMATQRAFNYPDRDSEWFCGFAYTPVKGLGYEKGIHRRDPSSVIKVGDLYYVYYTKSVGVFFGSSHQGHPDHKIFPWDHADVWYAVSPDGINWEEQGCAVKRGPKGSVDDRTCCTPDVMAHKGKYYLVYQVQQFSVHYSGISENVGMSVADNPNGPWEKCPGTIIEPMAEGHWFGDNNSYNSGKFTGACHDPMLLHYKDKYCLYYKCAVRQSDDPGNRWKMRYAGPDTRWGVAFSDTPTGPYTHSEYNPVTNSGHETMLWPYKGGIAALLNRDGPEKDTIQYSEDGVNFELMARVDNTPQAGGAYRSEDHDDYPLKGVQWGLCHSDERGSEWNYILRFDVDPRLTYAQHHQYYETDNKNIF